MFDNIKPIGISTRAVAEIKKIFQNKNIPDSYGLRLGVKGGGCRGVSLLIGFDKQKPTDITYEIEGIPVYVEKKHTLYLIGKEVDYYESNDAKGFLLKE